MQNSKSSKVEITFKFTKSMYKLYAQTHFSHSVWDSPGSLGCKEKQNWGIGISILVRLRLINTFSVRILILSGNSNLRYRRLIKKEYLKDYTIQQTQKIYYSIKIRRRLTYIIFIHPKCIPWKRYCLKNYTRRRDK